MCLWDLDGLCVSAGARSGDPGRHDRECYFFDDVSPAEMDELMRLAKGQAIVVGFGGSTTGEGKGEWRFAEPSSEVFGDLVPEESLTDDELCVS